MYIVLIVKGLLDFSVISSCLHILNMFKRVCHSMFLSCWNVSHVIVHVRFRTNKSARLFCVCVGKSLCLSFCMSVWYMYVCLSVLSVCMNVVFYIFLTYKSTSRGCSIPLFLSFLEMGAILGLKAKKNRT